MDQPARPNRARWLLAVLAPLALAACAPAASPASQALPPGPTTAFRATLEVAQPPEQFDLVQLALDFAPGAFTPSHTHGGLGYVTVIEGEITVREAGAEKRYKAGESWVERPGVFAEVGNAGTTRARVLGTFLLPKGAALTTVQAATGTQQTQLPPGPTTAARADQPVARSPGAMDLVHLVLDFAPGAFTPLHTHGGEGVVTVLEGEILVRDEKGAERRLKVGQFWPERPGEYAVVGNPGTTRARVLVTFLLPKGAALTTNR